MELRYENLKQTMVGCVNYFNIANIRNIVLKLDKWIRRKIRMCYCN